MLKEKIKILVTDDSLVTRKFLVNMLSTDPDIEVIGTANDGAEAIAFIRKRKPDVITMDINMPVMDGFEATLNIMRELPIPIVIVSSAFSNTDATKKFKALEAGAVGILPLPVGLGHPDYEKSMKHFVSYMKTMSEVKLIRRWSHTPGSIRKDVNTQLQISTPPAPKVEPSHIINLIAIGASAGGPMVVKEILEKLPENLTVPIIIVQHIESEFTQGYVDWLNLTSKIKVLIAKDGESMEPGKAYMAPGDYHIGVKSANTLRISKEAPDNGLRPSVAFLFRSVLNVYHHKSICILLSGMGVDGAKELKMLRDAGSITIAQNAETALIHGMPGEAIKLGGASHIMSPSQIINFIQKRVSTISK